MLHTTNESTPSWFHSFLLLKASSSAITYLLMLHSPNHLLAPSRLHARTAHFTTIRPRDQETWLSISNDDPSSVLRHSPWPSHGKRIVRFFLGSDLRHPLLSFLLRPGHERSTELSLIALQLPLKALYIYTAHSSFLTGSIHVSLQNKVGPWSLGLTNTLGERRGKGQTAKKEINSK